MILIVLMIVALVLRIITPSMKKMQQQMKFEILPLLLNFAGCDFVVNDYGAGGSSGNPFLDKIKDTFTFRIFNEKSPYNAAQEYEYKNTRLFDYFNICKTDDRITGNYNSIPLELSDIDLKHESGSGKNHRVVQVFKGLLIKFPMNKEFTGDIIVKKDTLKLLGDSENRVHLEDPVFEKYFDVQTSNKIIGMQILTADIMEELVNFEREIKIRYDIYIKNNEIYLRFHTGPMFEMKRKKDQIINKEVTYKYFTILKFTYNVAQNIINAINNVQI